MYVECPGPPTRRRRRADIDVTGRPDPAAWDELWDLYFDAFEPLEELALLSHLFDRTSFDALLDDERITKLVATVDGKAVGLAMITNALDVVPQISPAFLHRRYPDESARGAVFFGIMVFVDESYRRTSTFARLVAGMGQITAAHGGVVVFDICRHNLEALELDRQMRSIARWFPGSGFEVIDQQSYFAVSLPRQSDDRMPVTALPVDTSSEHLGEIVVDGAAAGADGAHPSDLVSTGSSDAAPI